MPLYQAVILAMVQGLTEFLPVSSTAHLVLFPWFAHWHDPGLTFDVALHAGTLMAVLVYFWRLWMRMLAAVTGLSGNDPGARENRRLFGYLVLGTIPAALAGYKFERLAENQFRSPTVIGIALMAVALLMWVAEAVSRRNEEDLSQVTLADAVAVGVAQALAVIPGVSRSGITMTAGLFAGMNRETCARFSFLLSTPIIAGAALKKGLEIRHEGLPAEMRLPFAAGIIVSALVGYAVIGWLIRYLERRTFKLFVIYRLALGILVLVLGWVAKPSIH
jgi:undecaprenyl-diphosphatase